MCEILTTLYFEKAHVDPAAPDDPDRDKVILSKGHAAPMLYRILAERGFFPVEEMATLRQPGSRLQGHPHMGDVPGVEATAGPLGCGYAFALGMMLADRMDRQTSYTYAVLGDGELDEGIVWETCLNASKQKADHLIGILDWNGVQLDGPTDAIMPLGDLAAKFEAFGYATRTVDGHDIAALCDAIDWCKSVTGKPTMILAKTVKGKGVSFMEGKSEWHGKPIGDAEFQVAIAELEARLHD